MKRSIGSQQQQGGGREKRSATRTGQNWNGKRPDARIDLQFATGAYRVVRKESGLASEEEERQTASRGGLAWGWLIGEERYRPGLCLGALGALVGTAGLGDKEGQPEKASSLLGSPVESSRVGFAELVLGGWLVLVCTYREELLNGLQLYPYYLVGSIRQICSLSQRQQQLEFCARFRTYQCTSTGVRP